MRQGHTVNVRDNIVSRASHNPGLRADAFDEKIISFVEDTSLRFL